MQVKRNVLISLLLGGLRLLKVKWSNVAKTLRKGKVLHYSQVDDYYYIGNEFFLLRTTSNPTKTVINTIKNKNKRHLELQTIKDKIDSLLNHESLLDIKMEYLDCRIFVDKRLKQYILLHAELANMVEGTTHVVGGGQRNPIKLSKGDEYIVIMPILVGCNQDFRFLRSLNTLNTPANTTHCKDCGWALCQDTTAEQYICNKWEHNVYAGDFCSYGFQKDIL